MRERKPNRLNSFDYSRDGSYFVTFCVKNREHCLSRIENNVVNHSFSGRIVVQTIEWLKEQYPYVKIHEYMVMPDHVHVLIEINRGMYVGTGRIVGTGRNLSLQIATCLYNTATIAIHLDKI